jgi:hypothetical protein
MAVVKWSNGMINPLKFCGILVYSKPRSRPLVHYKCPVTCTLKRKKVYKSQEVSISAWWASLRLVDHRCIDLAR